MKKKIVALALALSLSMVVGALAPTSLATEKATDAIEIETEEVVVPEDAIVDSQNAQNPQVENLDKIPVIKTGVLVIYRTRAGIRVGQELVMVPTYLTYVPKDLLKKVPAGYELIDNVPVLRGVTLATAFVAPIEEEKPGPENPDPENPDPENPDPENPDPENPDPENPDPENPDPDKPGPEDPDPITPVDPVDPVKPVDPAKPEVTPADKETVDNDAKTDAKTDAKADAKADAKDKSVPKTGDSSDVTVWFSLAALSGAAVVVYARKRKDA